MADPPGGGGGDPPPGDPPPGGGDPPPPGDWYSVLSEELRGDAAVTALKDKPVGDVVAAYRDLFKKTSESAPPTSAKDYGIAMPKSFEEAAKDPQVRVQLQATLDGMLATAHAAGLSKAQAQALVEHEAKISLAELAAAKKETSDAEKALKEKWGPDFEEKRAFTKRAIDALPETLQKIIERAGVGSHPHFIELIYMIGEAQSEGRLRKGDPGGDQKSIAQVLYGGKTQ